MTTPSDAVRFCLHALQARVYQCAARFRVVVAGRRWGKTTHAAIELVMRGLTGKPGRYWYIGPDRTNAKDILWQQLKELVDPSWLARAPMETELSIDLITGCQLAIKGAEEPDRLRGRGLRFVVLDEYADMKADTWEAVIRPQLADYKAPALFIGTPKAFNHFYDLYQLGQGVHPDWQSWQFKSLENPCLDPSEIENARATSDPRTFRQEWEASFEAVAGRAYYAFVRADHVKPVVLNRALPVCLSFDFNIDPATAVLGQVDNGLPRVWRNVKVRHAGGEATRAAARAAKDLLVQAGYGGEVRIYGDATGKSGKTTGPSDHAVLREVFPGAAWYISHHNPHQRDRVAAVNACCETMTGVKRLQVDPSCAALIADLEQVVLDEHGEPDKSNPELTHVSDALGYWLVKDFPLVRHIGGGAEHLAWL